MKKENIYISKNLVPNIPILIIDFDESSLDDIGLRKEADRIIRNFKSIENDFPIYTSCCSKDYHSISNLNKRTELKRWFYDTNGFIEDIKNLKIDTIQIAGIYRELCVCQVAKYITKKLYGSIKAIILDNNDYSISGNFLDDPDDEPYYDLEQEIKDDGFQPIRY